MFRIIGADGREYGPVSAETIRDWIAQGRANADTKVQAEGSTDWKPLSALPEFAEALGRHAATPPPPSFQTGPQSPPGTIYTPLPADVETRDYSLDIGRCFGRGWEIVMQNFWLTVGASFVLGLIVSAVGLIGGVCYGGMYILLLKLLRGQKAEFGDAFAGFSVAFLQLFLVGLVSSLLIAVGVIFCIIPGIYLAVVWAFAIPLVADKRMEFWPAMELSRKVVNKHWWTVFGMTLVSILVGLAGYLVLCVGIFIALPVISGAWAAAYEQVFCSERALQPVGRSGT
jgi:hypothetical protein